MKCRNIKLNIVVIFPVYLICLSFFAQEGTNMVVNGNFEETSGKVRRLGMINEAEGWISPTGISADLFVADAKSPDVQTPVNVYGREEPKDGNNYAGIITYSYNDKENRQYITSKLRMPMKKGMRYKVVFHASLAELSKYSANKLGAHFSNKMVSSKEKVPALIQETHVKHPDDEIFTGMYGWDLVCGEYVAEGGEKYITIGNFESNDNVGNERNKKPREVSGSQIVAAYYYIDDISVYLLGPDERCECPYANKVERKTSTVYQRAPMLSSNMTAADKIEIQSVFYAYEKHNLTLASQKAVNDVATYMQEDENLKVKIIGHSDESENESDPSISKKRAEHVKSQLIEKGITADRISIEDAKNNIPSKYADSYDDEKTEEAKKRRVSFEVVK